MNKKQIMVYLFMLFCIFATDSMITISINSNTLYYYGFRWVAIILSPIFFLLTIDIRRANKKWAILICVVAVSLGITALFNSDYAFAIFIKLIYFFLGYSAVKYFSPKWIIKTFVDIMGVVAVVSLGCYFVSLINVNAFDFLPNIRIVAAKSGRVSNFANAILCVIAKDYWGALPRNYGMFAEPGIYQVYLVFALMMLLYGDFDKKGLKVTIFLVSMITTFSTTGYIVTICLFLYYFLTNYKISNTVRFLAISGSTFIVFMIIQNELIFNTVFGKFQNSGDASTISRLYSFPINALIWIKSPLCGVGPVKMNELIEPIAMSLAKSEFFHNTNTFMYTLACFGISVFGIELSKGILLAKELTKGGFLRTLGLFTIIFVCLSGENLTYSLCIEVLLFCGAFGLIETELEGELYDIS